MKLKEQIALVTGAGRGIGKAIAMTLAAEGARVIVNSRTKSELEQVKSEIELAGGMAEIAVGDITQDDVIEKMFKNVERAHGRLDILVNNAGIGCFAPVRSFDMADFDNMWRLNVRALFLCTKLGIQIMEKRSKGIVVNISSLAGKNAFVGGAGYAATKWALLGFSRCLMLEERDQNIRTITISPGSVDTGFSPQRNQEKTKRALSAQDVADTVLMAVVMPGRAMVSEIDIRPTRP